MSSTNQAAALDGVDAIDKETDVTSGEEGPAEGTSSPKDGDIEKASEARPPTADIPDGGLEAWLVVLGAWCTSFCSWGWLNSIGVFQEYYQSELLSQYSPSTVSWIPSLEIFFMLFMGPFVGIIYDHYGPRWLLLVGSFLHVFGIMMTSLGKEYYQILLSQGLCSAIGVSAIFQPALTSVISWFDKRRGAAFGILFTGSSFGGVLFPIMVSHLIREVGFGWAMRTCAFIMLFLLIIANLTVHPRVRPRPHKVTIAQHITPLKEAKFLLLTAGFFLFTYGFFIPVNYIQVQALDAGMSPNLAQYLLPILNAGSLFGRVFSGFAGDKIGRYNIFIVVCYVSGIWILALWLPDTSNAAMFAFAALFGFFSGAFVALISPLIIQVSPMSELGYRTGLILFLISWAGLTTNPINGAIADSASGWTGLKIFAGVFCLAGTTFVLVARIRLVGWNPLARI